MSNTRFQTQYDRHSSPGELNTMPSEFVPGMSYSVYEILRSQSPPSVQRNLEYNALSDDDEPLPPSIDLTDIHENEHLIQEKQRMLKELKDEFERKKKEKAGSSGPVAQPTPSDGAPSE